MHHHARHAQLFGERSHGPLRCVRWPGFERGIQNLFFQLWRESPARPVPCRLCGQRLYPTCAKRGAGGDHRRARQTKLFGNRMIRHPFLGQQNYPAFLGHSLWRCSGADQRFQLRFGGLINGKSGGGRKHDAIESCLSYIVNSYVGRDTSSISGGQLLDKQYERRGSGETNAKQLARLKVRWGYMFRNGTARIQGIRWYRFATIGLCRSAIAQAAPSGGSSRESLRSLFLRITGSTATTEPQ